MWKFDNDPDVPIGELQPYLQNYFPDWRAIITFPKADFREGVYIFKAHLRKAWRRLAISSHMTLATLSELIIDSFDFEHDHLDMFQYLDRFGRTIEVTHPSADGSIHTPEVKIGDLPLVEGGNMTYIFDFGDWWEFLIELETIHPNQSNLNQASILNSHGEAPLQYPYQEYQEYDELEDNDSTSDYEGQLARIQTVFNLPEIPEVTQAHLEHYLKWLQGQLKVPCILTGIESMGYFSWEERFEFGYGSPQEYEKNKKEYGSYHQCYELNTLDKAKVEGDWDILAPVSRVSDGKRFTIPLSELQAADRSSENYQLLNDYTVWYVNWR
ncbi:MAG: hypothetical protein QNJ54_24755 [Prochloraceae cyanobacterium]|nr:hypothetical protein [Prochloraceae cyanobacterium]